MRGGGFEALGNELAKCGNASFRVLAGVDTVLLRGEHSDVLSRETVERMRPVLPLLDVVEIPGRGHTPILDEPESVGAIEAVLARAAATPTGE